MKWFSFERVVGIQPSEVALILLCHYSYTLFTTFFVHESQSQNVAWTFIRLFFFQRKMKWPTVKSNRKKIGIETFTDGRIGINLIKCN